MDFDFGYESTSNVDNDNVDKGVVNNGDVTNIDNGKKDNGDNSTNIDDLNNADKNDIKDDVKGDDKKDDDSNKLEAGTVIEVGDKIYKVDEQGNVLDSDGNIFKEAKDVSDWVNSFETVKNDNDSDSITINAIQDAFDVVITDEDDKLVEFENNIEGVKAYFNAIIENSKEEHFQAAINNLLDKYPFVEDAINYYVTNGNTLDGFNEIPDRSTIVIDEDNESQQEAIIKAAWKERGQKGDVNSYIDYLKNAGILYSSAKEELEALQQADRDAKNARAAEAERIEAERNKELADYWDDVKAVIDSRKIAGYQIPESIIINRDGRKLSATPNDFFNYLYRTDKDGTTAYMRDLAKETADSRRDDEILRAYLKFVGGNYSNLVDMAINNKQVEKLKLKARQSTNSSIKVKRPNKTNNNTNNIDFGY